MVQAARLFMGGEWRVPASDSRFEVVNASSEEPLGSVPAADHADIDRAVTYARSAFEDPEGWAIWPARRRADALRSFADEIARRGPALAAAVSQQVGMPISTALGMEGDYPAAIVRYYADAIEAFEFEESHEHMAGGTATVLRRPVGVVAAVVPWNAPQVLGAFKYAPALAAGCAVVLKPSPQAVLDAQILAEAAEASSLPPGVLNVLPADAEVAGYLVTHPGVDKVSFTGSTQVGRWIAEVCGRMFRPVTLELGGKSAAIFLDDVELDLDAMRDRVYAATMLNNGQTCFLSTRILAPASRYDEVVDFFVAFMDSLVIGDALDPLTRVGPMATPVQRERVEGFIASGLASGARLARGRGTPVRSRPGWFVEPTLFADVDEDSTIAQEEIFGPVLSVIRYDGDAEAIRIANNSRYGLAGSVWTTDLDRGGRVARGIQTGTVGINRYRTDIASPFGGVKDSGVGRDMGVQALSNYLTTTSFYA